MDVMLVVVRVGALVVAFGAAAAWAAASVTRRRYDAL